MAETPSGDDVQRADNVLRDVGTPQATRRAIVGRMSAGVLGTGALSMLLSACGGGGKSSPGKAGTTAAAAGATTTSSSSGSDQTTTILNTAATAEALAVTFLTRLLKAPTGKTKQFADVLKQANTAEYDHYQFLTGAGAKALTTKFWIPNAWFHNPFGTLEVAETLFVDAYLVAMTQFAKDGNDKLARYAGEIGGVEAEHLALVRFAEGKLPNDYGFMPFKYDSLDGVVGALGAAGLGLGKQGSKAGRFYEFPGQPPSSATTSIESKEAK